MKLALRQTIGMAAALALLAGPALAQQQGQWQGQNHGGPPQQAAPYQPGSGMGSPGMGSPGVSRQNMGGPGDKGQHPLMAAPQHPEYAPPQQHSEDRPQHHGYGGWHQGDHYNGHRYVVRDWHRHHLNPPPEGYEWVQSGDDYVLIAIATGIIASIIANSMAH